MFDSKNIKYKTKAIENFYSSHRIKWDQFYPSEKAIFESLAINSDTRILDLGCGCGGLGLALAERFCSESYTGVDISQAAIASAKQMNPNATFISGDILELSDKELPNSAFDIVVSLSCVDWNIEFEKMLSLAWSYVRPGGSLIATFRLTNDFETEPKNSITKSYQYINFDGKMDGEIAPYVVLNANNLFSRLLSFSPKSVTAHGYWGKPSKSAVTPYKKICFSAFSIQKKLQNELHFDPNQFKFT
ncbi:bifunctional 2-polyprenyl-6-hydroxyphenol methylase/3-demethylubiquinol 3-O-methyltransferase UbiG [Polynucleobacter sp. MWH-UH2A]|uniref:class I SAM-dependent methyltransferase n=1 Tax=Polynucleobacter sp. MWH-UH2A TaxID=1855617 RepID=UPI001BFE5C2E|nr:class I SAM-dependent methyltransferase [Polynucleobacter sp. MWH-UH2A]QWD64376.1 methyltransferase domain-containing protein [Polynucleobacter sp. MWH-UH2A]